MQRHARTIAPLALAVLLAAPVAAAEPGWTLRLHGVWTKPNLVLPRVESDVPVDASATSALGAGASLEYRFHSRVGLGVDAFHARPDVVLEANLPEGRFSVSDKFGFTAFTAGPVFHVTSGPAADVTLAATVGYAGHGDLRFATSAGTLDLQGDGGFCWGVGAGVDIYPGASDWAIHGGVGLYRSTPTFTNRANAAVERATVNSVVVTFGAAYRF